MADTSALDIYLEKMADALRTMNWLLQGQFWDAAINRAYYAMFYGASALLARDGRQFREHGKLLGALGHDYVKTNRLDRRFHKMILSAYADRQEADYSLATGSDDENARLRAAQAHEFAEEIQRQLKRI